MILLQNIAIAVIAGTVCLIPTCIFAQASVVENEPATIYVDAKAGLDTNPGTSSKPFLTITAASKVALANNIKNVGTKILINPGTYRETLNIGSTTNETTSAITFQAAKTGTAIISGSDVLTGWTQSSVNPAIYTRPWDYNFGACALPAGWPTQIQPIVMRTEMVFVNSIPLAQVLSSSQVIMGTFYVDETANQIQIWPVTGTNMNTATVETAIRPNTLTVSGRSNMVFRGLSFQHARSCINFDGAVVSSSVNMLFDTIQANWNNFGGLGIDTSNQVTVQNSVASHNGGVGFGTYRALNGLYQFDEADYNNWRGAMGGFYDWAMGGFKMFEMHAGVFNQVFAYRNQGEGLWFDTDGENIMIEDATLVENDATNLQLEVDEGPASLSDSILCNSIGSGMTLVNSAYATITNNTFYNNGDGISPGHAEIFVTAVEGGRTIINWQTGQSETFGTTNINLSNNIFQNSNAGQTLFGTYLVGQDWTAFISTLASSGNHWYDPTGTNKFTLPVNQTVDLAAFRNATGQDSSSTFSSSPAPAGCTAPAATYSDYTLSSDKRVYTMAAGKITINLTVKSYGWGLVYLGGLVLPAGVTGTFTKASLTSGLSTLTLTASKSAVNATIPLTIFSQSNGRVHPVTVLITVAPPTS
jgi:hypothetical protein